MFGTTIRMHIYMRHIILSRLVPAFALATYLGLLIDLCLRKYHNAYTVIGLQCTATIHNIYSISIVYTIYTTYAYCKGIRIIHTYLNGHVDVPCLNVLGRLQGQSQKLLGRLQGQRQKLLGRFQGQRQKLLGRLLALVVHHSQLVIIGV